MTFPDSLAGLVFVYYYDKYDTSDDIDKITDIDKRILIIESNNA